eukprot:Rmarinus@m.18853
MDLTQALVAVVQGPEDHRHQAEAQLQELEKQNAVLFILSLSRELGSESKPIESRKLAGIVLKNIFTSKNDALREELRQKWHSLEDAVKDEVKNNTTMALASPAPGAGSTAALLLANLASFELTAGKWQELLPLLLQSVAQADNVPLRQSALDAIGYICEELDPQLLSNFSDQILTAVVQCMLPSEQNIRIRVAATKALLNSTQFIRSNMDREAERSHIVKTTLQCVDPQQDELSEVALETLVKLSQLYYTKLGEFMGEFFNVAVSVVQAHQTASENCVLQAIEFFSTIAEVELDMKFDAEDAKASGETPEIECKDYIVQAVMVVVPALLQVIAGQDEDAEPEAWCPAVAAANCLELVSEDIGDGIVEVVMPFVQQHAGSADWRMKTTSFVAFGCMLAGPETSKLVEKQLLQQGVGVLVQSADDADIHVREAAVWALSRMCALHARVVSADLLPLIVNKLITKLAPPEDVRVAKIACEALHDFADNYLEDCEEQTSQLSQFFQAVVHQLLGTTTRPDCDVVLRNNAYGAANLWIQAGAQDTEEACLKLLGPVLESLASTLQRESESQLQALLCGILHAIIMRFPNEVRSQADAIMQLLLVITQQKNSTLHEEALLNIGCIASSLEKDFVKYLDQVMPLMLFGLKDWQERAVCNIAVGVVGDIARAVEGELFRFCDDIVVALMENLKNHFVDRSIKPPIFSCLGDIAMSVGPRFERYTSAVLPLLASASKQTVDPNDLEMVEYLTTLQESLLDSFSGIINGLQDSPELLQPVREYLSPMGDLIRNIAADPNRLEKTVRKAYSLLGDVARHFPDVGRQIKSQPFVHSMRCELQQSQDQRTRKYVEWTDNIFNQLPA